MGGRFSNPASRFRRLRLGFVLLLWTRHLQRNKPTRSSRYSRTRGDTRDARRGILASSSGTRGASPARYARRGLGEELV